MRLRIAAIIHSQTAAQQHPFFTQHVFVYLIIATVGLYKNKQDRQRMYNETLRRVRVTTVDVEKQQVLNIECVSVVLIIQHAKRMRHIAICGLPGSTIFWPQFLINATNFGKKLLNIKCVLIFSTALVYNISHSKKNSVRYKYFVQNSPCHVNNNNNNNNNNYYYYYYY